ncbi:MAG TPA: tol-pal system-associated acyl-CoA thioesterase [Beijerinckiaceae bacterium]
MVDSDRQTGLRPAEGTIAAGRHLLPVRVYYEDTDFSGVVYHASYLRFLERGRTEFLRAAGVDQSVLHAEGEGLIFAVRSLTIDYLKPARMDDVLLVETRTAEVRGASLTVAQRILRGEEVLVAADVRVAAIAAGRPVRIPDALRAILQEPLSREGEGQG